ncbi:hypothetical protein D0Z08_21800 [Nocardioides immobilis]|uniref:Uncharacterized protein n=1 Tax=Nocardioides immobilis TaxID=2049295 RepID=A0A417XX56_9ACTN|nr:DUF169 domain-containing protein [Nocardioides immobilis]RHW25068.1 hypothetical protein D0Z08_21800 [Nocardioides immobilis]
MTTSSALAQRLTALLGLTRPPVAVSFDAPASERTSPVTPQPAGCCFWAPAQQQRLDTVAADHANCSVGSYTHGLIPLHQAAAGADTAALVDSSWVTEEDLVGAAALPFRPASITYQPLADADDPDVVLAQLSPAALMTLMGAVPDLTLARKPQCVIVPLAAAGQVAVSPGCAVSRTRTGLPDDDLTCAIPGRDLESIVERLEASTASDRAVSEFALADIANNFATA